MGGKLFNGRRVNREEFFEIQTEVVAWLRTNLNSADVLDLHQLEDKKSFGDLDLIVSNELAEKCIDFLKHSDIQYKKNGDTLSFLYKDVQVDLIFVRKELLYFSANYFSHGDKSNLIGKLIKHHYGITFSSLGPYYKFNYGNGVYVYKQFLEDTISPDYDVIVFKLLGLAPKASYTEEELFEWIYSSPLFVKDIYTLDKLTSEQRRRDKDRPFYQRWLAWLDTKEDKPAISFSVCFLDRVLHSVYPKFNPYESFHLKQYRIKLKERDIFSGTRISNSLSDKVKLEGKALGDFIKYLKENHYEEVLSLGVSMNDTSLYRDLINKLYEEYKS